MSRRSLIFCFSALAAMVIMIVAAVAFLYRDNKAAGVVEYRYGLAYAVPSNAVMACFLSEAADISSPILSSFDFPASLAEFMKSPDGENLSRRPMAMSMHYSGTLAPLYIFDFGQVSSADTEEASKLIEFSLQHGFQAEFVNCSELVEDGPLASHSIVIIAKTKAQLGICRNQLKQGTSIVDAKGFSEVAQKAYGDALFLPFETSKVLFEKAVSRKYFRARFGSNAGREYSAAASFFSSIGNWMVMSLEGDNDFVCLHDYYDGSDFMSVMNHGSPSVSTVSDMLPSYTRFALTLPMRDVSSYVSSYAAYLESAKSKVSNQAWQERLKNSSGVSPLKLIDRLGVTEVASASFMCGKSMERVNLLKIDNADTVLLRGTGDDSFQGSPKLRTFRFNDHIASVFGKYFRLNDESCFTYMNGWLVTGSRSAVQEYVSGRALEYTLKTYMADAGKEDLLADRISSCVIYLNIPEKDTKLAELINGDMQELHDVFKDSEYSPIVVSIYNKDDVMHSDVLAYQLEHKRSRAPKYERDTVVVVPKGPFKVKNSGTGRTNLFYQQSNGAICLKEETGKGLWGVPFKHNICGTAHDIDYYANGNRQILFGAESSLYLIDRMGRFVKGFPVDLGKEILLGPDVYDFNGVNAYNVLVLHKDNTIEMYNIHGKKPESWKGIYPPADNTIKYLPERLAVGNSTYWVVRTSVQTLIYPFYGGEPLTKFSGDAMFLPTAVVKVKDAATIEAESYDGKVRSVKVK